MAISGTKEWSASSVNICSGCAHSCLYCYAKANAIRFKRKTADNWATEFIKTDPIQKNYGKRKGRIMLPTTHDITPATIGPVINVVKKLLEAGNELLIVSKPSLVLIERLVREIQSHDYSARQLVTFRFTIGSYLDSTLRYWEPGAPCFADRLAALAWCKLDGWQTSVSCEPMLERRERMVELVQMLTPEVTDTLWLGKMNQSRARLKANGVTFDEELLIRLTAIEDAQADGAVRLLHKELKDHPKVRWKESVKKVVGVPLATEAGTDE